MYSLDLRTLNCVVDSNILGIDHDLFHIFEHIKGPLLGLYYDTDKYRPED